MSNKKNLELNAIKKSDLNHYIEEFCSSCEEYLQKYDKISLGVAVASIAILYYTSKKHKKWFEKKEIELLRCLGVFLPESFDKPLSNSIKEIGESMVNTPEFFELYAYYCADQNQPDEVPDSPFDNNINWEEVIINIIDLIDYNNDDSIICFAMPITIASFEYGVDNYMYFLTKEADCKNEINLFTLRSDGAISIKTVSGNKETIVINLIREFNNLLDGAKKSLVPNMPDMPCDHDYGFYQYLWANYYGKMVDFLQSA